MAKRPEWNICFGCGHTINLHKDDSCGAYKCNCTEFVESNQ